MMDDILKQIKAGEVSGGDCLKTHSGQNVS